MVIIKINKMQLNKQTLDQYVEDGWLIKQTHPRLPLTIYNYSRATQYEERWDEITLQCRGLIVDDKGNVVARPFKKFFNIEEAKHTATEDYTVYEKLDGSLIILFFYAGNWLFASRGSFISDQAIMAKKISKKYRLALLDDKDLYEVIKQHPHDLTYLFEIIY